MAADLVWDRVGNVLIACHSANSPSDEEWSGMVGEMDKNPEIEGILVSTAGATISATQREQLQQAFDRSRMRAAVLTDSRLVRGAVTALSWFKIPVRAFEPNKFEAAIASIGATEPEAVVKRLRELQARVS